MSAKSQGRIPIRSVLVQAGDCGVCGGLPDRRASLAFGGYFKGCIQDLRMNSRRLQFYPVSVPVSSYRLQSSTRVTRGCTGDDSCSVSYIHSSISTVLVQSLLQFTACSGQQMTNWQARLVWLTWEVLAELATYQQQYLNILNLLLMMWWIFKYYYWLHHLQCSQFWYASLQAYLFTISYIYIYI